MKIIRQELPLLNKRVREKRRFIQVVTGPRQVGKTTIVRQLLNKQPRIPSLYVAADAVAAAIRHGSAGSGQQHG